MTIPYISRYHFGEIEIDGQAYTKDLIITPEGVVPNWWRESGHELSEIDLQSAMEAQPEVLVIGQGRYGRMAVPAEVRRKLEQAGIRVITEPTHQAWQTYNQLREHKRTVAVLHLTC